MSTQILASAIAPGEPVRKSARYHPSIWGDFFISCTFEDAILQSWSEEAATLKEKVRRTLTTDFAAKPMEEKLALLDAIQRMGISYHFTAEIEEAFRQIVNQYGYYPHDVEANLNTLSLLFRLLRENGYNISCDIFNKLRDGEGKFKESLKTNIRGMLSLYEASHVRMHGETILDEALDFTETYLHSMVSFLNPGTSNQVLHALNRPIRKTLPRVEAPQYFAFYQENKSHNEVLLRFAKLDFNILQKKHQKELSVITKWWKNMEVTTKFPFARDRITECYFWILGVYYEPEYALARKFTTKVISMTSIIDDIYDNYGIKSELEKFTDAIERWDINAMDELPEYMKICYQALLDVYREMEEEMAKEGRTYAVSYAKEAMKGVVKAYYEECQWLNSDKVPTMEEYMKVALVSTGYPLLTTASFVGMGDIATKEAFDWLLSEPRVLKASSVICRIMDDIVSNKFEQQRGHIPSAVQCYMSQYGVSEKQTCDEFNKQITNAWKDKNQALLEPPPTIPMPLLMRILNFSRVMDLLYKDEDGYCNVGTKLKHGIANLFINPIKV